MRTFDYDLIVIGAGAAGLTASTGAGSFGAKTLLIEKEKELGGDCLHYGCVPSKSLVKSAHAYHIAKMSEKYGLPRIELPPVVFKDITNRIQNIISKIQEHDSPDWLYQKYHVETKFGKPRFLDKHTIELAGEKIRGRSFILAMGSSPFIPPIEGLDKTPFITNLDVFSLETLPPSLLILGAGPIGIEMAQSFNRLGSQVTVIDAADQILSKEDRDIAEYMQKILEEEGIKFFLNAQAKKVSKNDGIIELLLARGGAETTISGQTLLVAVGRRPNAKGIGLEKAGVEYSEKGIIVDRRMRTTNASIYACGDINGLYPFTHVAAAEAGIAMMNAVTRVPLKMDYTRVPWCTYLDPEVASIGLNEKQAKMKNEPYRIQKDYFKNNDRALAENQTSGFIKILISSKERPIGVQIIGAHAGELIGEWVAAINGKVSLAAIAQAIHPYPTFSEITKLACCNYLAGKLFNPTTRKILKFIFRLQGPSF